MNYAGGDGNSASLRVVDSWKVSCDSISCDEKRIGVSGSIKALMTLKNKFRYKNKVCDYSIESFMLNLNHEMSHLANAEIFLLDISEKLSGTVKTKTPCSALVSQYGNSAKVMFDKMQADEIELDQTYYPYEYEQSMQRGLYYDE